MFRDSEIIRMTSILNICGLFKNGETREYQFLGSCSGNGRKNLENKWLFLVDRKGYSCLYDRGDKTPAFFSVKIV